MCCVCWSLVDSLLRWSAPGILPCGFLVLCLQRRIFTWEMIVVRWDLASLAMWHLHAGGCSCSGGWECGAGPHQCWVDPRPLSRKATWSRGVVPGTRNLKFIHGWGWWSVLLRIVCNLCAPSATVGAYVGRRTGRGERLNTRMSTIYEEQKSKSLSISSV